MKKSVLFSALLFTACAAFAQEKSPSWTKDLIVYEIATKSFNSPNAPESGTFNSVREKLPYLEKLGINGIWLTGNSWSDPHHFYNIWTQYACIRPDSIDATLGTREDFRNLINDAHKHGIRVFLDVITHGVMNDSPLKDEHPDWFKGGSWGMTDYDWQGHIESLDNWWVKTFTSYCLEDGVDGYRLDVNSYRPDLWHKIRKNCLDAGKEIVIIQENLLYNDNMMDFCQNPFALAVSHDKSQITDAPQVTDPAKFYNDKAAFLTGEWRNKRPEGYRPDGLYMSIELSCHDNGWDGYPADENPYVAKGSRSLMGYNAFLAPAVPIVFSGEEFAADYVPIPWHSGGLFGKTGINQGRWLYGSWIQWDQLKDKNKKAVLADVQKMIAIRKAHSDVICAYPVDGDGRILLSLDPLSGEVDKPYIMCRKGEKAVLVAGNRKETAQTVKVKIPLAELGFQSGAKATDLWNKKGSTVTLSDGTLEFTIGADKTPGGGLSVWLIEQ